MALFLSCFYSLSKKKKNKLKSFSQKLKSFTLIFAILSCRPCKRCYIKVKKESFCRFSGVLDRFLRTSVECRIGEIHVYRHYVRLCMCVKVMREVSLSPFLQTPLTPLCTEVLPINKNSHPFVLSERMASAKEKIISSLGKKNYFIINF